MGKLHTPEARLLHHEGIPKLVELIVGAPVLLVALFLLLPVVIRAVCARKKRISSEGGDLVVFHGPAYEGLATCKSVDTIIILDNLGTYPFSPSIAPEFFSSHRCGFYIAAG